MFDATGAFAKQFTPIDGGYLYYPSRKIGGKFVTAKEYQALVEEWERIAGRSGRWKIAGAVAIAVLFWTVISTMLALPEWSASIVVCGCVVAVSARILWASLAPRRLTKDRPAVTMPRDVAEARRHALGMLDWPFVAFALLISAAILFVSIRSPGESITSWTWLAGSGLMFVGYIWIAVQKLRGR